MGREWNEVPDETDELVLEDTQEYRVADSGDDFDEEYEEGLDGDLEEDEEFDEFDQDSEFDDEEEFEEDVEDGEDEYYDDAEGDEFYEEEVEDPGDTAKPVSPPREPISSRAKAVWAALVVQARGVEPPTMPDFDRKLAAGVVGILLASLAVGIGAYALGKGSGDDVDVAKLEGEAAGKQAGAIEGASQGYAAGFTKGRDAGFKKTYEPAYKLSFKRAFEQAGLDVPSDKDIEVPEP